MQIAILDNGLTSASKIKRDTWINAYRAYRIYIKQSHNQQAWSNLVDAMHAANTDSGESLGVIIDEMLKYAHAKRKSRGYTAQVQLYARLLEHKNQKLHKQWAGYDFYIDNLDISRSDIPPAVEEPKVVRPKWWSFDVHYCWCAMDDERYQYDNYSLSQIVRCLAEGKLLITPDNVYPKRLT